MRPDAPLENPVPKSEFVLKPRSSRTISILLSLVLLVALPGIALASSYWSTLSYSTFHSGSNRQYDGNNMHIDLTSAESKNLANNWHFVTLIRECGWFCDDVWLGNRALLRAGVGTGTWNGVGAGEYRFYFNKASDGVTITSNNVHMWSN